MCSSTICTNVRTYSIYVCMYVCMWDKLKTANTEMLMLAGIKFTMFTILVLCVSMLTCAN